MKASKTLIIGWDSADWKLIDSFINKGLMPSLKAFLKHGMRANLATLQPVLSPLLWTSIATGKRAHEHGILGFVQANELTNTVEPIRSNSRKSKAFWNILNEAGIQTQVVNWWPSFPVEKVNGQMVSNQSFAWPEKTEDWNLQNGHVHPKELTAQIEELRMLPSELSLAHLKPFFPDLDLVDFKSDEIVKQVAAILAKCANVHNVITHLLEEETWDLAAVYYEALDHFGHVAMKYHPPKLEGISDSDFKKYRNVITAAYRFHDMMLGRLLDLAGADCNVIIISDHGFESGKLRSAQLPDLPAAPALEHRAFGIFCANGPDIKKNAQVFGASLLDFLPTLLHLYDLPIGEDLPGRVLKELLVKDAPIGSIESWEITNSKPEFYEVGEFENTLLIKELEALGYVNLANGDKLKTVKLELAYNKAVSLRHGKKLNEALEIAKEIYQEDKSLRISTLLADLLLQSSHFKELEDLINAWPTAVKKHPFGLFIFGMKDLQTGRTEQALKAFQQIEEKGLVSIQLFVEIARTFSIMGKLDLAREYYHKVLALHEDEPSALAGLGELAVQEQKWQEGAGYLEKSLALRFFQPHTHYLLALCFLGKKELKAALQAVNIALKQAPKHKKAKLLFAKLSGKAVSPHKETLVVTGFPRSGTSMLMRILKFGGLQLKADNHRKADNHNPEGYFEWEVVKNLGVSNKDFTETNGKVVKVVSPLLRYLPNNRHYKVLWMDRPIIELILSQEKMKKPKGGNSSKNLLVDFPFQLALNYEKEQDLIEKWVDNQVNITWKKFSYRDFITQPEASIKALNEFLGGVLNEKSAMEAIIPGLYRNKIG